MKTCSYRALLKRYIFSYFPDHGSEKKVYACKFCLKQFDRSVNLKAHLRANHNNESAAPPSAPPAPLAIKQEQVRQEYDPYVGQQYIEVPVMQSNAYGTLVLPGGKWVIFDTRPFVGHI